MKAQTLTQKLEQAIWIAHSLFQRNKTSGATANLSFLHEGHLYISGTGTCFGTLGTEDFSCLDLQGNHLSGVSPSKEYPLHLHFYRHNPTIRAVLHTHSFYATLWSCYCKGNAASAIPSHTPYLAMRLGDIGLVPYAPPGSQELFSAFAAALCEKKGYLLRNHGPVVGEGDLLAAFYGLEELEESAQIAWALRNEGMEELP